MGESGGIRRYTEDQLHKVTLASKVSLAKAGLCSRLTKAQLLLQLLVFICVAGPT